MSIQDETKTVVKPPANSRFDTCRKLSIVCILPIYYRCNQENRTTLINYVVRH